MNAGICVGPGAKCGTPCRRRLRGFHAPTRKLPRPSTGIRVRPGWGSVSVAPCFNTGWRVPPLVSPGWGERSSGGECGGRRVEFRPIVPAAFYFPAWGHAAAKRCVKVHRIHDNRPLSGAGLCHQPRATATQQHQHAHRQHQQQHGCWLRHCCPLHRQQAMGVQAAGVPLQALR